MTDTVRILDHIIERLATATKQIGWGLHHALTSNKRKISGAATEFKGVDAAGERLFDHRESGGDSAGKPRPAVPAEHREPDSFGHREPDDSMHHEPGHARVDTGGSLDKLFADARRGRRPQESDLSFARIADEVYRPPARDGDHVVIDGFRRVTPNELPAGIGAELDNPKSGFTSAVYRRDNADGSQDTVLAFAGTAERNWRDIWRDVQTNITQGMGLREPQYEQAVRLAKLMKVHSGGNLAVTGHSLGGGLADLAALTSDVPAVTFNAAGLADQTLERFGLDPAAARAYADGGLIRSYVVDGEPVTAFHDDLSRRRSLIGGVLGGVMGSPAGGATGWAVGRMLGPSRAGLGGLLGAGLAGVTTGTAVAQGIGRARPSLGCRIVLPDPAPPTNPGLRTRLGHRIDLHRMNAVIDSLDRSRPWTAPNSDPGNYGLMA
ncbi:hypothetical protein AB0B25_03370 [Nocardia sp. NPDC049190]|uniref:lipase family protein n=1 Tax=Nocardia sp. NPDC049190 TaxID=3155650 RepID=UPI0033D8C25F